MPPKEERPKKSTTQRKKPLLRKTIQPKLPAAIVVARVPRSIVSLPTMPVPVAEVVVPPKAGPQWWVVALCVLFASAAAAIVGYVVIGRSFDPAEEVMTSSNPVTASFFSYTSVVTPVTVTDYYVSSPEECPLGDAPSMESEKPVGAEKMYVDFVISVAGDEVSPETFDLDLKRLGQLVDLASKHRLKTTLQLSSAFVTTALARGTTEIAAWAKAGHEVAMAFDDLAPDAPYGSWLLAMHESLDDLQKLCQCSVTSWSGGNTNGQIYEVAEELGLTTNVDWVSPDGTVPDGMTVVNPWTPGGSGDLTAMQTFDPFGSVVYLPSGVYPTACHDVIAPFTSDGFTHATKALYASMTVASADKINVFRLLTSPSDFGDPVDDEIELVAWSAWLTSVVDPQIKSGKLVASTDSATSAVFVTWLDQNIGKIELK